MAEWLQAVISLPPRAAEAASAALFEAGCRSVWEDLPDDRGRAVLKSAFDSSDAMRLMTELPLAAERISEAFGFGAGEVAIELEVKLLEDYDAAWRKDQQPIRVSARLVVAPSFWKVDPPAEGESPPLVLTVDPGAAFGSGRHPTTFLCMRLLSALSEAASGPGGAGGGTPGGGDAGGGTPGGAPSWSASGRPLKILDLGSGSGILAIASALLFPEADVLGLDTDAETVGTARKNAEANGVSKRAEFRSGTLDGELSGFDLIVSNITLNPLLELAVELTRAARPGASLVLSGLLSDQAEECARAYQRLGWHWLRHLGQAEWSALELALPADGADDAEGGPDPARELVPEPSLETPPFTLEELPSPVSQDDDFRQ
ncbi:MAG: 50S ribosomal protein L11 methyltransferase [Deltaproteobacteria bacterium]|jgi:ribosomal protein L11 methyltransferase|nr:50S ribosomal protein L11 methyltransferase [Deltaproteobacteria bacterium]